MHNRSVSRVASFGHALRGVKLLLAGQVNARLHLLAGLLVVALGAWLGIGALEWALLSAVIGLVLCAEALNTGIEIVVDLVSPQWHRLARDAKDVAAAGVLLASLGALATGAWIFLPRLLVRWLPAG
ncbi:diacylglycerol kinase family protein [Malikia sp.]|uniref:diacylglycerol kinase family protein n=1 Tax=Malikia sp. TaxID=2070706 RepID=UPI00263047BE|nr:diacylglycerol kinase family protein [Malikia sp.]MDD2727779.1 diacylglycerol kinase family protein [Malikia sp.]